MPRTDLRSKLARWHADVDNAFRGWNDAWLDPGFRELGYQRGAGLCAGADPDRAGRRTTNTARARQIEIAQEECYCPVDVALLPNTRHAPHREAPDATLKAVADFANRILRDHAEAAFAA